MDGCVSDAMMKGLRWLKMRRFRARKTETTPTSRSPKERVDRVTRRGRTRMGRKACTETKGGRRVRRHQVTQTLEGTALAKVVEVPRG